MQQEARWFVWERCCLGYDNFDVIGRRNVNNPLSLLPSTHDRLTEGLKFLPERPRTSDNESPEICRWAASLWSSREFQSCTKPKVRPVRWCRSDWAWPFDPERPGSTTDIPPIRASCDPWRHSPGTLRSTSHGSVAFRNRIGHFRFQLQDHETRVICGMQTIPSMRDFSWIPDSIGRSWKLCIFKLCIFIKIAFF